MVEPQITKTADNGGADRTADRVIKRLRSMKQVTYYLKQIYLDTRILLRFRKLYPQKVRLPPHGHLVHIDPHDKRARKKLIADSVRKKYSRNQDFWHRACEYFRPGVAIDIGVNFGECLFSANYDPATSVIGIEANPGLQHFLLKSCAAHPQHQQIQLFSAAAGENSHQELTFHIDERWSGGSTAGNVEHNRGNRPFKKVTVPTLSVDDAVRSLNDDDGHSPIVFKIDVEGYKRHVIRGMREILKSNRPLVGLAEFDTKLLANAGVDPDQFWKELQQDFKVSMFVSKRSVLNILNESLDEAMQHLTKRHWHTDLLLFRNASSPARFIETWLTTRKVA